MKEKISEIIANTASITFEDNNAFRKWLFLLGEKEGLFLNDLDHTYSSDFIKELFEQLIIMKFLSILNISNNNLLKEKLRHIFITFSSGSKDEYFQLISEFGIPIKKFCITGFQALDYMRNLIKRETRQDSDSVKYSYFFVHYGGNVLSELNAIFSQTLSYTS